MYRTPTHESRYKQGTRDRESKSRGGRYEEPRESSEGSSSEEDEESTDRCTEDSEDTTESHFEGRRRRRGDISAESSGLERERPFTRYKRPEDVLAKAYYADEKSKKQDKVTQKNFLSPFPSFLIPPIYRNAPGRTGYRNPSVDAVTENREYLMNYERPVRTTPRNPYDDTRTRCTHRCRKDKRSCELPRDKKDVKHQKGYKSERVLTCLQGESSLDPSSTFSKNPHSHESSFVGPMDNRRRQKSPSIDRKAKELLNCRKSKDYLQGKDNQPKTRTSIQGRGSPVDDTVREIIRTKAEEDRKEKTSGAGQVREKLVYVVEEEEEGKKVTKLETDLFSVNEILTIKKDLMELSEFAKKLKKLKEMKKDAEKGKPSSKTSCQCKPVAELLKDVNKRIEALEARQEELEKGSLKTGPKTATDLDSNKTTNLKASSDSPPNSPVVREQSALTTALSLPKTETNLSKVGFSKNSEIANELMDIKNQLQKLEKRRMSENTPEAGPLGKPKVAKKRDLGIAVFSSKTYILTSENYKKKMDGMKVKDKEKSKECFPGVENTKSKNDQVQENVSNWLKNMSPVQERSESDIVKLLEEGVEGEGDSLAATCVDSPVFRGSGFVNKEPPKNRASAVKSANIEGPDIEVLMKNEKMGKAGKEQIPHLSYKECVLTTSGRLFFLRSDDECLGGSLIEGKITPKPEGSSQLKPVRKKIRRSVSSGSIPSAILTKEYIARMRARAAKPPKAPLESAHELSWSSSGLKDQKGARNTNVKNLLSALSKDKVIKESKNNIVKKLGGNLRGFKKNEEVKSSSSFSQLLGTVDLDAGTPGKTSETIDKDERTDSMQVYSVGPIAKFNFKSLEDSAPPRSPWKETVRRRRLVVDPPSLILKRIPILEPECDRREIPTTSQPKYEEPRPSRKPECDCENCCMRRVKGYSSEDRLSDIETPSSGVSNASADDPEVKRCKSLNERRERIMEKKRRRKCNAEEVRERIQERIRQAECRRSQRRRRNKERVEERRSREREYRKRSRDRARRKSGECYMRVESREGVRKRRSKEPCRPTKRLSRSSIFKVGSKFFHRCKPRICCQPECHISICKTANPCENEKPPAPNVSEPQDYSEIVSKLQKQKQPEEREKMEESCIFGSFLKSLRRLYPKFSHLQFASFTGDMSERKAPQQQPKKDAEVLENEIEECVTDEDSGDTCEAASHVYSLHSVKSKPHHHHHHHRHITTSSSQNVHRRNYEQSTEHLKNCKCIKVYLQSQKSQHWPGVTSGQDTDKKSDKNEDEKTEEQTNEKTDEVACSDSPQSNKTYNRNDFIFPGVVPGVQFVGHSCEEKCRRLCDTPCRSKCRSTCPRVRCRSYRHKRRDRCRGVRHHKKRPLTGRLCACVRCGNIHEKIVNKNPPRQVGECSQGYGKFIESPNPPMFSFLRYFCKHKPSRKSIFKRISEVRYLKTCSGKKGNKQCQECGRAGCSASRVHSSERSCARLKHGRTRSAEANCYCCNMKDRRKRRRRGRRCGCSDRCDRPRRKKRRRRKRYCECPDNSISIQKPSQIEFCACPALYDITRTTDKKARALRACNEHCTNSNTCSDETTETTTTTTTPTDTMAEEEKKQRKLNQIEKKIRRRDSKLKDKMSSIQNLLRNIQKLRRIKCQVSSHPEMNECDKCNTTRQVQLVPELKEESSSFFQRLKNMRGNGDEKKKKCEKKV